MDDNYVLLAEKETMWAEMLMDVLKDNNIPCVSFPVHGVGFALKTGIKDSLRVCVPSEHLQRASELLEELFSGASLDEQEQFESQNEI